MSYSLALNAAIVSVIFFVLKFIEMRFITKDNLPPKVLVRESVLVFLAFIMANFLLSQFGKVDAKKMVEVFTDNPSF